MLIQRRPCTASMRAITHLTPQADTEKQKDQVSLGQRIKSGATDLVTWFLRRQVPTTFPAIDEGKGEDIKSKLKTGDVLITTGMGSANLAHFGYWTVGASYTHAAIYDGKGKVVETRAEGVSEGPIDEFLQGPVKFTVVRPPYKNEAQAAQVVGEALKLKGTPFDFKFDSRDNSALSCSELIEVAMKKVDPEMEVPDIEKFGYLTTVADGFTEMEGAEIVVDGKSQYWRNQVHQWPLHLATAVGVGVGAVLGGPVGAGLGGLLAHEGFLAAHKLF